MRIMHIALGGCLRPPPVAYGMTEDTGGHISYLLGAAMAQAERPEVAAVEIVTRAFDDARLGACHALPRQEIGPRCAILRLRTGRSDYLAKEVLEAELPALRDAFLDLVGRQIRRPDVIHAHFADAAELARAAAERFGIPWIYSSHSLALDKAGPGAVGPALVRRIERERAAVREADAIIASSRDEAERQLPAYDAGAEGRVHHVAPGVTTPPGGDAARARALVAPFLRDLSRPIVLAIARPIGKKNLGALVRAYAGSPELRDRANLVILAGLREGLTGQGDEPDRVLSDLFDQVDRHDLWGRVALPRWHEAADVADLYALAAEGGVFVNPAHHEPFGLTIVEAARADVPVVATRNGGPVDILRVLGFGELVDPASPSDIAGAVLRLLDDPDRAVRARAAGEIARARYDWTHWAERVFGICAGLVRPRRSPTRAAGTLVVCDIDGTLTGDREAALRFADWRERNRSGVRFAVATGRSLVEARRVLEDWDLPEPDLFITSVGSEIWRWTPRGPELCEAYAGTLAEGWDREAVARALASIGIASQPAYDQRRWKLSLFGSREDAARIEAALAAAGLLARVVHSHARYIDVLPPRAGKAAAVRFEAARLGLAAPDCIVAGDSGNDRDMLETFARSVLPANAAAELSDLAGPYRSPLAHANGVLDGLGRFGADAPALRVAAE